METWNILGAGAIGGLLACQFNQCDIPVQIIAKGSDNSKATQSITLTHHNQTLTYDIPLYQHDAPLKQVIITTKSYQTRDAITAIRHHLSPSATILVMQNGMGSTDWLQEQFPKATILAGTTTHGAYRESANKIVHAGIGDTWIGPLQEKNAPTAMAIFESWKAQGIHLEWDQNIEQRLWLKLAINCAINPLTVIYNCKNGELLKNSEAMDKIGRVLQEFNDVYRARFGAPPAANLLETITDVASKTAENISSMRQDFLAGRETEIEAISGYLVKQGDLYRIKCEQNLRLLDQVQALSQQVR